jgi:hypothetical protein
MPRGFAEEEQEEYEEDERQARRPATVSETIEHLSQRHSPSELIKQFSQAPPHRRNLDVLYGLYRKWMATNNVKAIRRFADECLLAHFSDQLLLKGGWQDNRECLKILWDEEVCFKGNWEGNKKPVEEFWEPYQEMIEKLMEMTMEENAGVAVEEKKPEAVVEEEKPEAHANAAEPAVVIDHLSVD